MHLFHYAWVLLDYRYLHLKCLHLVTLTSVLDVCEEKDGGIWSPPKGKGGKWPFPSPEI